MCTINMTFELPESKGINIEAFKKQVSNYVGYLISVPGIVWGENEKFDDSQKLTPGLQARLELARKEIDEGKCTTFHSKEDINSFFESL